ncbi:MAG: tryptophan-rich sensory protein [Bacilli bacterium]|nr:tryptophan-rich sensory protein [Bacilli bacterium]
MKELVNYIKNLTFKDVLLMIGILILYFLPYLIFGVDLEFYNSLIKINVPPFVFMVAWTIIYLCMALFVFWHLQIAKEEKNKTFWIYLVVNYLIESSYLPVFFVGHNLFLGFVVCILTFVTIVLVAIEAFAIKKESVFLLIPYILWSAFASVLAMLIYIWN